MFKPNLDSSWTYVAPYNAIMDKKGNIIAQLEPGSDADIGALLAKLPDVWRVLKGLINSHRPLEAQAIEDVQALVGEMGGSPWPFITNVEKPHKARVIVTLDCNRHCENCCNKEDVFNEHKILLHKEALLNYEEIMITGGEPMLIPDQVVDFVKWLRHAGYRGKIFLYTAWFNEKLAPFYAKLLTLIDGLQFTLHYEATEKEFAELKLLSESALLQLFRDKSFRLSIDERLFDTYDFLTIDLRYWSVVKRIKWLLNCPLPQGEELFICQL